VGFRNFVQALVREQEDNASAIGTTGFKTRSTSRHPLTAACANRPAVATTQVTPTFTEVFAIAGAFFLLAAFIFGPASRLAAMGCSTTITGSTPCISCLGTEPSAPATTAADQHWPTFVSRGRTSDVGENIECRRANKMSGSISVVRRYLALMSLLFQTPRMKGKRTVIRVVRTWKFAT
jgi:hypothetical protein